MKPVHGVLGLVAACAACCAVPFVAPLLFGAAGLGFGVAELPVLAAVTAGMAAFLLYAHLRKRKAACACGTSCPPKNG